MDRAHQSPGAQQTSAMPSWAWPEDAKPCNWTGFLQRLPHQGAEHGSCSFVPPLAAVVGGRCPLLRAPCQLLSPRPGGLIVGTQAGAGQQQATQPSIRGGE